ncbi:fungal-specific transcription factor domain-containing protein [Stachybotrys elegans]|uniref:Fungal-specific transcription factor domain-containing protein n=1 Tax=Stachybotrys elegans TaxID=80388 RepID=A0A8K0WX45_9HYPO|nr:fungal-specific transcription factor domain-containing protein [Stachybotrys elegans]
MPRTSFSHNPLLRVSRPVSACSRCRAAKVKCDGKLPACTACEKAGRENECSAANDQFARGKERSYVAALELRIEKLERRLQYAKSRKASVALHDPATSALAQVDRRDSLAKIRAAIHRKAARNRENSDVNALVSDFGFLSVNATTRDFEPSASNMTFARLVLAATVNDPLPDSVHSPLPPRHEANSIVRFYMTNHHTIFPFFLETTFLSLLDDLYRQDERVLKDADYWLIYMVLAIGSTAQSQQIHDDHYTRGVEFASKALDYADRALAPGHATQIQSLLILTQYSMLDPAHFDSWHLIGFTARAIIDLGFHQDPPMSSVSDKNILDLRRKIFYCAYSLDRAISMVHARSFSFTDDSINVAFPTYSSVGRKGSVSGPLAGPQPVDSALLLFQLRRAQSHWYQELYHSEAPITNSKSYVWQMCRDMREWGDKLPDTLPPETRRMFDQELRYSYVYCMAPSSKNPGISDYDRIIMFEHSMAYLDTMHDIALGGLNSAFYTYHDALKVYFMARQFVAVLRDATDMLLSGQMPPIPMPLAAGIQPPPIPRRQVQPGELATDNLERSLKCLEKVSVTMQKYAERWVDATTLKESFEVISSEIFSELQTRKQMRHAALEQRHQQQQLHHHQHHQAPHPYHNGMIAPPPMPGTMPGTIPGAMRLPPHSSPPREMRWVGVNMGQMMKGSANGNSNGNGV